MSISVDMENGLIVSVDWLSFTINSNYSVDDVIEFMGFKGELFEELHKGASGYKRMRKYENISVLYDGADNMGIHVNVSSQSIFTLFESYSRRLECETPFGVGYCLENQENIFAHLLSNIRKIGHLTRIDIAIDDIGANYYSLDELENECNLLHIRSKWRKRDSIVGKEIKTNEKQGHTINFGSRTSGIMLRVYDKKLEQNQYFVPGSDKYIAHEWVRWELELHKECANNIIECIELGMSVACIGMGVLNNYFNIINLDDSNRSRCSCQEKWIAFVQNASKIRISSSKCIRSIDDRLDVFKKQNGRIISLFTSASGGDITLWSDIARQYESKLSLADKMQINSCLEKGGII